MNKKQRRVEEQPDWLKRLKSNILEDKKDHKISALEEDVRQRLKGGTSAGKLIKIVNNVIS